MFRRIINCALLWLIFLPAYGQAWTLEDCVHYAMEHSIDLKRQAYSIERENLNLQEGKWAFVPKLSASTSYTMSSGRVLDPTTYEFVKTSYTGNNSASVSGDIILFEGGRKIRALSRAKLSLKAALVKDESLKNTLRIQIAEAYMDVLCAREQERVAGEAEALIATQYERTQNLYKAGTVTETDVLQLQSQLSTAKKDVSSARYAHQMARLALCDLLDLDDYMHFEIAEPPAPLSGDQDWNWEELLDGQPEIRLHEMQKELANLDYKLACSVLSPRLALTAGFGTSYSDARQKAMLNEDGTLRYEAYPFFNQYADNGSAYLSLSLSIPILNGMSARNGIRKARISAAEANLDLLEARKRVRKRILQAYMNCSLAKERYEQSLGESGYAEEVFRQVDRKYNLGAVDFVTWNMAIVDLAKARYSLAEAKYSYYLRREILNNYK